MKVRKCTCGKHTQLKLVNKIGRAKDELATIKNVPVYYCADCKKEYMTGPDSLKFEERVKKAVELGFSKFEFELSEKEMEVEYDQAAFGEYMDRQWMYYFGDTFFEEVVIKMELSAEARNFFMVYLLKSREAFQYFYPMRLRYGIEPIFDTVVSAIHHEPEKMPIKYKLIDQLGVGMEMVGQTVEVAEIKRFDRVLDNFLGYWSRSVYEKQEMQRCYQ
ncbi:YgiT-type zinc finger protein [Paenibacillus massiliensis]|uniref:YgiT-type zinc finger protein n=1 Tax=Paenibacillus massiliensis TaxID=225917 RepID=UPI00046FC7DB|nr:YgiT-type zinc finger protein [Paenibacillus massiliensis]